MELSTASISSISRVTFLKPVAEYTRYKYTSFARFHIDELLPLPILSLILFPLNENKMLLGWPYGLLRSVAKACQIQIELGGRGALFLLEKNRLPI